MAEKQGYPPANPTVPTTTSASPPQYSYNTPTSYGVQPSGNLPPPPPHGVAFAAGPGVVMINQPTRIFTHHSTSTVCQKCHQAVMTRPRSETGAITWLAAGGMLLFGCWLGCCLIPFCVPELQNTCHECPNCNNLIDVYKPL